MGKTDQLILHIGPYKTGSSAIQKFLQSKLSLEQYIKFEGAKNCNQIASHLYHSREDELRSFFDRRLLDKHCAIISAETLWNIDKMYAWHNTSCLHGLEKSHLKRLIQQNISFTLRLMNLSCCHLLNHMILYGKRRLR